MPIDFRRCAEAAAHAALAEAFARPEPHPRRRSRRRLRPVRAVVLGAGLVTTARVALNPAMRSELLQALARRFPIQELLDEIVLEADVVPDTDDGNDDPAADEQEQESGGQPDETHEKPARGSSARGASGRTANGRNAGGRGAAAKKPATSQPGRRHTARSRGDTNGQSKRKPPNRGTRA